MRNGFWEGGMMSHRIGLGYFNKAYLQVNNIYMEK